MRPSQQRFSPWPLTQTQPGCDRAAEKRRPHGQAASYIDERLCISPSSENLFRSVPIADLHRPHEANQCKSLIISEDNGVVACRQLHALCVEEMCSKKVSLGPALGGQEKKPLNQRSVISGIFSNLWRARQDSNLRPTDSKSGALSN
jgi:hypothetical protein